MTLSLPTHFSRPAGVRKYALTFAGLLACGACWILVPEVFRLQGSPSAAGESALLRGDLWADLAINESSHFGLEPPAGPEARTIETAALRAVKLAPVQARVWLLLAWLNAQSDPQKAAAFLKLSFYTGPTDDSLVPQYLSLLVRFDINSDDELQYVMERQLEKVILHHPELRPSLIAAYRQTSVKNQVFIKNASSRIAPAFVSELDKPNP